RCRRAALHQGRSSGGPSFRGVSASAGPRRPDRRRWFGAAASVVAVAVAVVLRNGLHCITVNDVQRIRRLQVNDAIVVVELGVTQMQLVGGSTGGVNDNFAPFLQLLFDELLLHPSTPPFVCTDVLRFAHFRRVAILSPIFLPGIKGISSVDDRPPTWYNVRCNDIRRP